MQSKYIATIVAIIFTIQPLEGASPKSKITITDYVQNGYKGRRGNERKTLLINNVKNCRGIRLKHAEIKCSHWQKNILEVFIKKNGSFYFPSGCLKNNHLLIKHQFLSVVLQNNMKDNEGNPLHINLVHTVNKCFHWPKNIIETRIGKLSCINVPRFCLENNHLFINNKLKTAGNHNLFPYLFEEITPIHHFLKSSTAKEKKLISGKLQLADLQTIHKKQELFIKHLAAFHEVYDNHKISYPGSQFRIDFILEALANLTHNKKKTLYYFAPNRSIEK